eukprot:gene6540-6766_t
MGQSSDQFERANVQYVMLRHRVCQAMDTTGWGTVIIMLDVILSLLSVVCYIITTYRVLLRALYTVDMVLACCFSLNWLFWLWVEENRPAYLFSVWTLIDFVTIGPSFVLYAFEAERGLVLPGLNLVRVLRILRVLRVFRMRNIMRRHLEGAVTEAAAKLAMSLLSILFIAAGMFFELEKYGPPSEVGATITFHEALYWASVTLSTVGYGDLSPSYWATQIMLIGLLILMFTLMPYLTGNLMDAITATSPYQRNRFKRFNKRGDLQHAVFMGAIDGGTMKGLLDELYHEDKGFNRQQAVFLCPQPPSLDVQHLLLTHTAAKKVTYLQGSPFRMEDLRRAAVDYASAVFLIAPKHDDEPALADRHTLMMVLTVGQFLQESHASLAETLTYAPNRLLHWLQHRTMDPPRFLPALFVQLVLSEGRVRLSQVLQSLQRSPGSGRSQGTAASAAAAAAAAAHLAVLQRQSAAPAGGCHKGEIDGGADGKHRTHGQDWQAPSEGQDWQAPSEGQDWQAPKASAHAFVAASGPTSISQSGPSFYGRSFLSKGQQLTTVSMGCHFWKRFGESIHVLCLAELKHALMAHSVVGVPGVITLLSNLVTSADFGTESAWKTSKVPQWMQEYLLGASQELYEVIDFPEALCGVTFKEAAGFIFDTTHAVLLAVEAKNGRDRNCLVLGNLEQVIQPHMRGYIISADISAVLVIINMNKEDFTCWRRLRKGQHPSSSLDSLNSGKEVSRGLAHRLRISQRQRHCPVLSGEGPEQQQLLCSPNKVMRNYGDAFMRQHYHMRPPGCVESSSDLVVEEVSLAGHTLVLGRPQSQEGLLALLAPMRGKRMASWRPIVIIDQSEPGTGGCWDILAQFRDLYYVQITESINDALLRASADRAAQAILVSPLTVAHGDSEESKLASQVMTDAMVLNIYQLLKSLNPDMQMFTQLIMPQSLAYLSPTICLRGLQKEQHMLLAPSYMSGSVFMASLLDRLMLNSYSNNASDRIVLQLLQRWVLGTARTNDLTQQYSDVIKCDHVALING